MASSLPHSHPTTGDKASSKSRHQCRELIGSRGLKWRPSGRLFVWGRNCLALPRRGIVGPGDSGMGGGPYGMTDDLTRRSDKDRSRQKRRFPAYPSLRLPALAVLFLGLSLGRFSSSALFTDNPFRRRAGPPVSLCVTPTYGLKLPASASGLPEPAAKSTIRLQPATTDRPIIDAPRQAPGWRDLRGCRDNTGASLRRRVHGGIDHLCWKSPSNGIIPVGCRRLKPLPSMRPTPPHQGRQDAFQRSSSAGSGSAPPRLPMPS